jgi:peptidoglycan hydrolase-like protein with peptidoglycan-binding domain
MRGDDIKRLQEYFIANGRLTVTNNTGYFGVLTRASVRKYQCDKNIVCTGDEASTGYGLVGPRTRAALAQ